MAEKRWSIPPGYYEKIAESDVNSRLHRVVSWATIKFVSLCHGNLALYAPQSALDIDSNVVVSSTHRSKKDTPLFVNATERIGLHHVRPYAKDPIFANWLMRRGYHGLGAFAVNRDKPDTVGIKHAAHSLLYKGQSLMNFSEEERIFKDVRNVADIKIGGILAAVTARVPILPLAFAGVAVEKNEDETKVLFKDKSAPLGLGLRIVGVFGDPINVEDFIEGDRPDDMKTGRTEFRAAREIQPLLQFALQQCLDTSYSIRESGLVVPDGLLRVA